MSGPWIICSESADKMYCFCCKLHPLKSISSLVHGGFCNWANVSKRLQDHEKSKYHIHATAQHLELYGAA